MRVELLRHCSDILAMRYELLVTRARLFALSKKFYATLE